MSDEKTTKDDKESKGVKIRDRRRFDSGGNERSEDSAPEPSSASSTSVMNEARESAEPGSESLNFSAFIMSLATQTLMQLGEMKPPPGISISVDRDAAHQTIEILRLLQRKTKGNLDEAEAKLMEEIVHTLMMSYVKSTSSSS